MNASAAITSFMPAPTQSSIVEFQTFTGLEYLMIDIASNYGLDKESWDDRIQWTRAQTKELETIASMTQEELKANPPKLLTEAESPALFYAGIMAREAARQGKPTGYPISLDATASGLQILSILSGCEKSARLCNVIPSSLTHDDREDAYTNLYVGMKSRSKLLSNLSRAEAKDAIMTSLYGSVAIPKKYFGEGESLEVFYQTLQEDIPGAWKLNLGLQGLWNPHAKSHDWVLPDNFHAHVKEMNLVDRFVQFRGYPSSVQVRRNQGSPTGLSLCPNIIHSIDGMVVRELHRRCDFDLSKMERLLKAILSGECGTSETREKDSTVLNLWNHYLNSGFLSVRIFDYLDGKNLGLVDVEVIKRLISTMPSKPFSVISVHDCFRVHPNYGNNLRRQYNQILHDLAQSNILAYLAYQITGQVIPVTKASDFTSEILLSNYALS